MSSNTLTRSKLKKLIVEALSDMDVGRKAAFSGAGVSPTPLDPHHASQLIKIANLLEGSAGYLPDLTAEMQDLAQKIFDAVHADQKGLKRAGRGGILSKQEEF
jgi:hypothetical protein